MTDTPSDETIRKMNSNWIHGACIKCGKEFLFWKDATGKRCNECERQGVSSTNNCLPHTKTSPASLKW